MKKRIFRLTAVVLVLGLALTGILATAATPAEAAVTSKITFHLYNGATPLTPKTTYWATVSGYPGTYGDGDTLDVPTDTTISYSLSSKGTAGTITSAWVTTKVTADVNLNLEYTTLIVNLYNKDTKLADGTKYWVTISGWGTAIHGDHVHLPPNTNISYSLSSKGTAGTITSAWVVRLGNGGGEGTGTWDLQYATVTFVFESGNTTYSTIISGWGSVANNQKAHLPPGTGVSIAAKYNGYQGPWYVRNFSAGDSTITWKMMPTP